MVMHVGTEGYESGFSFFTISSRLGPILPYFLIFSWLMSILEKSLIALLSILGRASELVCRGVLVVFSGLFGTGKSKNSNPSKEF